MLKLLLMTSIAWSAVSFLTVGTFGLLLRRRDYLAPRARRPA
jgi:hypothetical protein